MREKPETEAIMRAIKVLKDAGKAVEKADEVVFTADEVYHVFSYFMRVWAEQLASSGNEGDAQKVRDRLAELDSEHENRKNKWTYEVFRRSVKMQYERLAVVWCFYHPE